MKKKIMWVSLLFASYAIVFIGGTLTGRSNATSSFTKGFENANSQVILGHYATYRDIALKIKTGQYKDAQCHAELSATAMFDGLRGCLASKGCKISIEKKAREFAPEVLGEAMIPIEQRTQCSTP